jgi:hypothetical protein
MPDDRRHDEDTWEAGILYGQRRPRSRMGQPVSNPAIDQIRVLMSETLMDALPPAMEEGAKRIEKRYETLGTLVIGAVVLTALATTAIAVMMFLDRK